MKDSVLLKQNEASQYRFMKLGKDDCDRIINTVLPNKHKADVAAQFLEDYGFSVLNIETIGELKDNEIGVDKYIEEKILMGPHGNGIWEPSGNVIDLCPPYKQRVDDGSPLSATERRQMTQKFYTAGRLIKAKVNSENDTHGIIFRTYSKS